MPNDIESSGNVSITGMAAFGDIHAIHGNQLQPAFVYIDHMGGTVLDSMEYNIGKIDKVTGVAHGNIMFLPHHQKVQSGATVTDNGIYRALRLDLPIVRWAVTNNGATTPQIMAYGDRNYGHEFLELNAPPGSNSVDVNALDVTFTSTQFEWNTVPVNWSEQGFQLFFGKQRIGGLSSSQPSSVTVAWRVSASEFELELNTNEPPIVRIDGRVIRYGIGALQAEAAIAGSVANVDLSQQFYVKVTYIAGRMQITMTGMSFPIVLHLNRMWRSTIAGLPVDADGERVANYVYVPKGVANRFPAGAPTLRYWEAGKSPEYGLVSNTTILGRWLAGQSVPAIPDSTRDQRFDVLQLGANLDMQSQIGILYERITQVSVRVKRYAHFSFSLHGIRFGVSGPEYISPPQQLGFTPLAYTQPTYDIHCGDDTFLGVYSTDLVSFEEFNVGGLKPELYIVDETLPNSQVSQYSVYATGGGQTGFQAIQYQNNLCYRYSPGVERVSVRYPGVSELTPPEEASYSVFPIYAGDNDLASYLISVDERLSFDFGSMRVNQQLDMVFNNYMGITQFASGTGINGAGNVAMCWRWGYAHQENGGISGASWWSTEEDPLNGPGYSRFYGFCDTYAYQGRSGSYTMSMLGKNLIARLDDTTIYAPPNFDGWNHYRAVYTILSMAGIPDDRIGFMDKVPSDPYGLEATDPDYATGGFFLPIGAGSNPWTPITRGMTAGQLLSMIQQVSQFVMYANAYGIWQYEPFMRDATGTPKRIFREYYPFDGNYGLTQMWDVEVTYSTADVRNEVIVLGIDAYNPVSFLDPILVSKRDEDSINAPSGEQSANYVGWKKNFAIVDSRFATHEFAEKTAEKLFKTMRQPSILVSFSCWGQPDIYPMDFIGVEYNRSGLSGYPAILGVSPTSDNTVPLFVTNIQTTITRTARGLVPQSRITGRYIPLDAYQTVGNDVGNRYNKKTNTDQTQSNQTGSSTGSIA